MLEIIGGFPGSGKSKLLYDKINETVKGGFHTLLIVPEQQLVFAEHRLADTVCPRDMLKADVLSFRRLANSVFREYGGLQCNYPGKGADILIMQRAIISVLPLLRIYKNTSPADMRTVKKILEARRAFSINSITPAELSEVCEGMNEKSKLKDKLFDLSVIMSAYDVILKNSFDDPDDDLTRLCHMPELAEYLEKRYVFIDSFNSFTKQEYQVLSLMLKYAKGVCIAINYTPSDTRASSKKTNDCVRILKSLAKQYTDSEFCEIFAEHKNENSDLEWLKRNLFSPSKQLFHGIPENISAFSAQDPVSELEYVFRDILMYVRNGGRFRDCLICSPDISSYSGLLSDMGKRYGIPLFTSGRYSLSCRSAIRAIRSAIRVCGENFSLDSVLEYIKSGFSPISSDNCDILEDYIRALGIKGAKKWEKEWTLDPEGGRARYSREEKLALLNEQREAILSAFQNLIPVISEKCSCGEKLKALTEFALETHIPEKLEGLAQMSMANGDILSASYHRATWQNICLCFETLYSVCSDVICDTNQFIKYIDTVIESADLGIIPTSNDEVLTGDLLLIRPESPKKVYIIGMSDSCFPTEASGGIFSNDDIYKLAEYDIKIADNIEDRLYNDFFSLFCVSCVAESSLCISFSSLSPSGEAVSASSVMREFFSIFPELKNESVSLRTLFELDYIRKNSDRKNVCNANDIIGRDVLDRIFGNKMILSQSKLDTFAMCPFSYFYKYIVKIRDEKTPEMKSDILGTVLHAIFEEFMKEADASGKKLTELSDDECEEMICRIVNKISELYDADGDDLRRENLFRRIKRTAFLIIRDIREEFNRSRFSPVGYELSVGNNSEDAMIPSPVLLLDDGTQIEFSGIIDRVDTCKNENGDVLVKITDYKTYEKDIKADDIDKGINLQMFLYLIAVCSSENSTFDKISGREGNKKYIPAGVFYHISKRPENNDSISRNGFVLGREDIIDALGGKGARNSLAIPGTQRVVNDNEFEKILENVMSSVKRSASRIKNGECSISPLKDAKHDGCAYCNFRPICRLGVASAPNSEDFSASSDNAEDN